MTSNAPRETHEVVSVRIPYRWLRALEEVGAIDNKNVSQVLRDAIGFYFAWHLKRGMQMGLIDRFGNRIKQKSRRR